MAEQVTGDRYVVLDGKLLEIKRQLRQRTGYPYILDQLEQGLQALIEGRFSQESDKNALDALFTSPQDQIANLRRWNEERSWDFSNEDFARVESQIAELSSEEGLKRWVLVPYLDDLLQTIEALIQLAAQQQSGRIYRSDRLQQLDEKHIRLLEGITYPGKCLMWVLVDLGCDLDRKPRDVRSAEHSLHIAGLAAAAQYPKWVRAIYTKVGGIYIPAVFLVGIQVNLNTSDDPEKDDWSGVFVIYFDQSPRRIFVYVFKDDDGVSRWAVVRGVRELRV